MLPFFGEKLAASGPRKSSSFIDTEIEEPDINMSLISSSVEYADFTLSPNKSLNLILLFSELITIYVFSITKHPRSNISELPSIKSGLESFSIPTYVELDIEISSRTPFSISSNFIKS